MNPVWKGGPHPTLICLNNDQEVNKEPQSSETPDLTAQSMTIPPNPQEMSHSTVLSQVSPTKKSQILAESAASNGGTDAPSTVDFEDTEGFFLHSPEPLVLHRGSQCNIKCLQRSSGKA
ncbi:hypothetical protein AALO_G00006400 [Alosa alosa]|uniref:Prolactin receptor n=1 Tax=Alosa alosa TaxID=278164 RepID=A0AAV6HF23_9TELE|nr:hypothetical protein AALO_G00006400 [Alosa alosa]